MSESPTNSSVTLTTPRALSSSQFPHEPKSTSKKKYNVEDGGIRNCEHSRPSGAGAPQQQPVRLTCLPASEPKKIEPKQAPAAPIACALPAPLAPASEPKKIEPKQAPAAPIACALPAPLAPAPWAPAAPAAPAIQPIYMMQPARAPSTIPTPIPASTPSTLRLCWNFVYIVTVMGFVLAIIYVYRLPEMNTKLRLEIEKLKLEVELTRLTTTAEIRKAEINRDLKLSVDKMKLQQEHEQNLEGLHMQQRMTEKIIESNTETVEKVSGIWNKERVVMKRTYLDGKDVEVFLSNMIRGRAGILDAGSLLTNSVSEYFNPKQEECEGDKCKKELDEL